LVVLVKSGWAMAVGTVIVVKRRPPGFSTADLESDSNGWDVIQGRDDVTVSTSHLQQELRCIPNQDVAPQKHVGTHAKRGSAHELL
jgi:hypothetical protein